jgi:hypothetical protein
MNGFASMLSSGASGVVRVRLCSTLVLGVAIAGAASGQTVKIPLAKKFTTDAASVISTASFNPQIAKPRPGKERAENPVIKIPKGPPNSLVAGSGSITSDRVTPLAAKFPGISSTGWQPPDCDIAVGPNHVVQVVNSDIAFFRKSDGVKTLQQGFNTFFAGVGLQTDFLFDPKAFYDPISRRFFVLCLEEDDTAKISKLLLAVSDDNDPSGNWFRYRIESKGTFGTNEAWLDYPGFSCNKDAVVVTGNMFGFTSGSFGASFVIIKKASLLSGAPATVNTFFDGNSFTAQAARTSDGAVDRIYTVSSSNNTTQLKIHALTNLLGTPQVTSTTLSVPAFTPPLDFVNGPNGTFLDSIDSRTFTTAYRAGTLVAAHNTSISFSDTRIATRWYEISTRGWPTSGTAPTLVQSGNLTGASGESLHMPAINVNRRGAISILMTRTSSSIMADVMVASRVKTDAPGRMSVPKKLAGSRGIFTFQGNRWGDYFSVNVDPNDDTTFWGNGETCGADGAWATEIVSWKVNDIDSATVYAAGTPTVIQGTYQRGSAASLTAVDGNTYDSRTAVVAGLGQTSTWETTIQTDLTTANVDYLAFKWNATGPAAATQFLFAYNWSTRAYEAVATRPVKSGQTETFEVTGNLSRFIGAGGSLGTVGAMKLAIRSLQPARNGVMPAPFVFKVDLLQARGLKK